MNASAMVVIVPPTARRRMDCASILTQTEKIVYPLLMPYAKTKSR
jgi:hypothetical protein